MRFIDPVEVLQAVPPEWIAKARDITLKLKAAGTLEERKLLLDSHAPLWRELKPSLLRVLNGKCWYCEARDMRSDSSLDHYRPKGRVAEEAGHPGYWWLAFVSNNYRIACTFCNSKRVDVLNNSSGGKHDHFPLATGGLRAWAENDDLALESPLLLDPCVPEDPQTLAFDETGIPSARSNSEAMRRRVTESVNRFHWHHKELIKARRAIFAEASSKCDVGDGLVRRFAQSGDVDVERVWWLGVGELAGRMRRSSEHSAVWIAALSGLRVSSPTAKEALEFR